MPTAATSRRRSTRSAATSTWATRRSARSPAFRGWRRPMACPRTGCTTSRPTPRSPPRTSGRRAKYLDHAPKLFEALRARFGFEHHLLHDVHHRLTPIEAGRLGKSLEPYRLFWMEDPTPAENQEGFRLIRQHTVTPIAVGEIFNTIYDCQTLITEQLIDYIRTTVVHAGGITHLRRIAHLAELYHVRTGCSRRNGSVAGMHGRRAAISTCGCTTSASRNTCDTRRRPTPCFRTPTTFKDGYLHPGDDAGARRGHRREARREISVQAERAAGQPSRRRLDVELVAAPIEADPV